MGLAASAGLTESREVPGQAPGEAELPGLACHRVRGGCLMLPPGPPVSAYGERVKPLAKTNECAPSLDPAGSPSGPAQPPGAARVGVAASWAPGPTSPAAIAARTAARPRAFLSSSRAGRS